MRRILLGLLVLTLAGVGMTSCAPEEPEPSATPPITETPEPPTEEEVEAEAIEVVTTFMALMDRVLTERVLPYDELSEVATEQIVSFANRDMQDFIDSGYVLQGSTTIANPMMTSREEQTTISAEQVDVTLCLDTTTTTVIDANGQEVVQGDVVRQTMLIGLERRDERLLVTSIAYPGEPEGIAGCAP